MKRACKEITPQRFNTSTLILALIAFRIFSHPSPRPNPYRSYPPLPSALAPNPEAVSKYLPSFPRLPTAATRMPRHRVSFMSSIIPISAQNQLQRRRQSILDILVGVSAPTQSPVHPPFSPPCLSFNNDYGNIPTIKERLWDSS